MKLFPSLSRRPLRTNNRRAASAPARRPSFRPRLEALEDRCVPSAAGALDPTFGNGTGYVITPTSGAANRATTVLIEPNGDIVATGGINYEFGVLRYAPSGALDTSFGPGGLALASFAGVTNAVGPSSALDPYAGTANGNDDVVQAGFANGSNELLLARFTTSGALDASFGTGGEVTSTFSGVSSINSARVVVTSSGQLLTYAGNGTQFVLARYNANGALDTTFGQGGYVVTSVPNLNGGGLSAPLFQLPNGQLMVVASQSNGDWDLYRFNADGTPDTTFGNQGVVTTSIGGTMSSAVLYPTAGTADDGKVLAAGVSAAGTWELARFNPDGSLDETFCTGGIAQTQISGGVEWNDLTLDANERIIVAGQTPNDHATLLARFNDNGTPDTTFGNGGLTTTNFSSNPPTQFYAVAVYPNAGLATDGDIVAGGSTVTVNTKVLVARYLGQDALFSINGPSSLTAGTSGTFTVTALNADGTVNTGYTGTVQITSSDGKAVLPGNVTITGGTGTFNVTLETAGTQSVAATDVTNSSINGDDAGITVTPAAASQVVFTEEPSSGTAGQTLGTVEATIEDAYGNVETGDNSDQVTLSVNSGPSTQLGGTLTETVAAGNAIFSNLLLDTSGSYTLAALASLAGGGSLGPAVSSGIAVASPVSLKFSSITYNSRTKLYSETVTLTNTTSGTLTGPMSLELTNLPSGVVLTDATGTTNGNPYLRFLTSGKTLKKGASTSITLTFTAASLGDITFGTEVVVGL